MGFSSIATRSNGDKVVSDWFNAIKQAGLLIEAFFGVSFISQTTLTLPASQGSATNVTGLLFDHTVVATGMVNFSVSRYNGSATQICTGRFSVFYRTESAAWDISSPVIDGDDPGITFSITSAGQVKYVLAAMSPAQTTGKLIFNALTFPA